MDKTFTIIVGPQGSGKTTYCAQRLSDHFRVSRDDLGEKKHIQVLNEAFSRSEPKIVLDKTNPTRRKRLLYLNKARKFGYKTKIIWFNVPRETCLKRIYERKRHPTLAVEDGDVALSWYFKTLRTPSPLEADEFEIIGDSPSYVNVKDLSKELEGRRYLIVGDIHGCLDELLQMLDERDFDLTNDVLITAGDLVDRGPKNRETLEFCMSLPHFVGIMGNHDDRFLRHFKGIKVTTTDGLEETISEFPDGLPNRISKFVESFHTILKTPHGYVVHAGFDPLLPVDKQQRRDCLYMRYYGGDGYFDSDLGQYWFKEWPKDGPTVFFGHEPNPKGYIPHNTVSLDGGCCFGEYLKAFDSKDGIVHYVNAKMCYAKETMR